ncbi:hypothetical protein [Pseudoramibacter faecis]|uniref:hypothetical protein n=1 Tax=Pseudoramibacter faecis TaxID=3108534 RepID=UPI002E7915DB|nr:hypothetical protein [Pseudoramibacter sp. HA2172]
MQLDLWRAAIVRMARTWAEVFLAYVAACRPMSPAGYREALIVAGFAALFALALALKGLPEVTPRV